MNKYPLWKNVILVLATVIGLLYASPNFFPQVPALQIGSNKSTAKIDDGVLRRVENALKGANMPNATSEITEKGISMKFDKDFQGLAEAQKLAQAQVGESYTVALNSLSTAPKWMASINALPMYLGLDLRGGVHFLMQVDMKGAIEKNFDRYGSEVRALLRDKKVSYAGASREGASVIVRFRNDADRDAGKKEMNEANADIAIAKLKRLAKGS